MTYIFLYMWVALSTVTSFWKGETIEGQFLVRDWALHNLLCLQSFPPPPNHHPHNYFFWNFSYLWKIWKNHTMNLSSIHLNTTINIHLFLFSLCIHPPPQHIHIASINADKKTTSKYFRMYFLVLRTSFTNTRKYNHNTIQLSNLRTLILTQ